MSGNMAIGDDIDESELNFLIVHYLSSIASRTDSSNENGKKLKKLSQSIKGLEKTLIQTGNWMQSIDWRGDARYPAYEEIAEKYQGINPDHLKKLLSEYLSLFQRHSVGPRFTTILGTQIFSAIPKKNEETKDGKGEQEVVDIVSTEELKVDHANGPFLCIQGRFRSDNSDSNSLFRRLWPHKRFSKDSPFIKQPSYMMEILRLLPCSFRQLPSTSVFKRLHRLKTVRGHKDNLYCIMIDNGSRMVTSDDTGLVKIWDVPSGYLRTTLRGHRKPIQDLAISPSNTILASCSEDCHIRLWNLEDGKPLGVLVSGDHPVSYLEFCRLPGSNRLFSASIHDSSVRMWDVNNPTQNPIIIDAGMPMRDGRANVLVTSIKSNNRGNYFAVGCNDGNTKVCEIKYQAVTINEGVQNSPGVSFKLKTDPIAFLSGHVGDVVAIMFASRKNLIATAGDDGTVRVWAVGQYYILHGACKLLHVLEHSSTTSQPNTGPVSEPVSCSKCGRGSGTPEMAALKTLCWCCDDSRIVTSASDMNIRIWCVKTGTVLHVVKIHKGIVYDLSVHPVDSRVVLSSSLDGRICLIDTSSGEVLRTFVMENEAFTDVRWAGAGHVFVAGTLSAQAIIFGTGAGESQRLAPDEQFFSTDYDPLIYDSLFNAIDERTQLPIGRAPRGVLVNRDGVAYERQPHLVETVNPNIDMYGLNLAMLGEVSRQREERTTRRADSRMSRMKRRRQRAILGDSEDSGDEILGISMYESSEDEDDNFSTHDYSIHDSDDSDWRHSDSDSSGEEYGSFTDYSAYEEVEEDEERRAPHRPMRRSRQRRRRGKKRRKPRPNMKTRLAGSPDPIEELPTGKKKRRIAGSSDDEYGSELDIVTVPSAKTKSKAKSNHILHVPSWLLAEKPSFWTYIPQRGDTVVLFSTGFKLYRDLFPQLAQRVLALNRHSLTLGSQGGGQSSSQDNTQGDLEVMEQLKGVRYTPPSPDFCMNLLCSVAGEKVEGPPQICGRIVDISYHPALSAMIPVHAILQIETITIDGSPKSTIFVPYHVSSTVPDFLVLLKRYHTSISRGWREGDEFRMWFAKPDSEGLSEASVQEGEYYSGNIISVNPFEGDPWECAIVKWSSGGESSQQSVNIWELVNGEPDQNDCIDGETAEQLLSRIRHIKKDKTSEWFRHPVNLSVFPNYLESVACPMDITLILTRLANGYYRQIDAIESDVNMIHLNTVNYNDPSSRIVKLALRVKTSLIRAIQDSKEGMTHDESHSHGKEEEEEEVDLTTKLPAAVSMPGDSVARRTVRIKPPVVLKFCTLYYQKYIFKSVLLYVPIPIISNVEMKKSRLEKLSTSNRAEKAEKELKRKEELAQEWKKYPYQPQVNVFPKDIYGQSISNDSNSRVPVHERWMSDMKNRKERLKQLREKVEAEEMKKQGLTFAPQISEKSKILAKQKGKEEHPPRPVHVPEYSFAPSATTRRSLEIVHNTLEKAGISTFEDRMAYYAVRKKRQDLELRGKLESEVPRPIPRLSATSDLIVKNIREMAERENDENPESREEVLVSVEKKYGIAAVKDPVERLGFVASERQKRLQKEMEETYYGQFSHKPEISEMAREVTASRWNNVDDKWKVFASNQSQISARKAIADQLEEEYRQTCTFNPNITSKGISSGRSGLSLNRIEEERNRKQGFLEMARQQQVAEELSGCTFKPSLSEKPFVSTSVDIGSISGIPEYLKTKKRAEEMAREQREYERKVFFEDAINLPPKKQLTQTKPFSLTQRSQRPSRVEDTRQQETMKECTFRPDTYASKLKTRVQAILQESDSEDSSESSDDEMAWKQVARRSFGTGAMGIS